MPAAEASPFRVDLDRLEGEAYAEHPVPVALSEGWIAAAFAETDATGFAASSARLRVLFQGDARVLVRGEIDLRFQVPCARCLEEAPVEVRSELCVNYVPSAQVRRAPWGEPDEDGLELESDDLEQIGYSGRELDLEPMLREQVAMTYPMRALCGRGEDCRGLCGVCGADLNAADWSKKCGAPGDCPAGANGAASQDSPRGDVNAQWLAQLAKLRDSHGGGKKS